MSRIGCVFVVAFIIIVFTLIREVVQAANNAFIEMTNNIDVFLSPVIDFIADGLEIFNIQDRFWSYLVFIVFTAIILKSLIGSILRK